MCVWGGGGGGEGRGIETIRVSLSANFGRRESRRGEAHDSVKRLLQKRT